MIIVTTILGVLGVFSIIYLNLLLSNLSRRLGTVTQMKPYYRWFLVAGAFVTIAALSQLIRGTAMLAPDLALSVFLEPWFALVTYHLPLAIGVTLDLAIVWCYWGWMFKEKMD